MYKYVLIGLFIANVCLARQFRCVEAYGGNYEDESMSIIQTKDGCFVVSGYTNSYGAGDFDALLMKVDEYGNPLWTRVFGGSGVDLLYSVIETNDSGLVIAGRTNSFGAGNYDILLAKYSKIGDFLWAKTIGGANDDYAFPIIPTSDGGYAIGGATDSWGNAYRDFFVVKLDSLFGLIWAAALGWLHPEDVRSIVQTADNGFAFTGNSWSFSSNDNAAILCRLDSLGNPLWCRNWGARSAPADNDVCFDIVIAPDNDLVCAGFTERYDAAGQRDIMVSKFTDAGVHLWTTTLGGASNDEGYSLVLLPDSSFTVAGISESFGSGSYDITISGIGKNGSHLWSNVFGGSDTDRIWSMGRTIDNGYALSGNTMSYGVDSIDMLIALADSTGNPGIASTISPTVGNPSPTIWTDAPSVVFPVPTVQNQTPSVISVVPDTHIIYRDSIALKVSDIYPNGGINQQALTARVHGAHFQGGFISAVEFHKTGYPDVAATSINVISDNLLTCVFDLNGVAPGHYHLIVENNSGVDSVPLCFSVYDPYPQDYRWIPTVVGNSSNDMFGVDVGGTAYWWAVDEMVVSYAGGIGNALASYWTGASWQQFEYGTESGAMVDVAIGDGNDDGMVEAFYANTYGYIYEYYYFGGWHMNSMGGVGNSFRAIAIGDANNDGAVEVYAGNWDFSVYQYIWDGSNWIGSVIGPSGSFMWKLAVGDGNNDNEMEVYLPSFDNSMYQYKWDGVNWTRTLVGDGNSFMYAVAIGDGNNDGNMEVYGANDDGNLYQFEWNGGSWIKTAVGTGSGGMHGVAVGDGDGDGVLEVYGGDNSGHLNQYTWSGSVWEDEIIAVNGANLVDIEVGDGNNDGEVEIYAASQYHNCVYQYKLEAAPWIALSDTSHDYGACYVGDSLDWEYLIISNIGSDTLFIDSIISNAPDFYIINPSYPDTLLINDSLLVTVRFKPTIDDTITGILSIHTDDPLTPTMNVNLRGVGIEGVPPEPFSLLAPVDSIILGISRPTFLWESSFDSSGIKNYEIYVADTMRASIFDTTWAADYDLQEGYNDWFIIVYDSVDNWRYSNETWSVLIDTTGPAFDSTTIWADTSFIGPFPVWTKISDMSGIDSVSLSFKRIEDPDWWCYPMDDSGGGWYYEEIAQVYVTDDTVKYYLYASDIANPFSSATDPPGAPANYYWFIANLTGILEQSKIPKKFSFRLMGNPVQNAASFKLGLPTDGEVYLQIYDVSGRLIDRPIAGKKQAGFHTIRWRPVSAGVYFYRLQSSWERKTGKLLILK
jgi:hypothetical protein